MAHPRRLWLAIFLAMISLSTLEARKIDFAEQFYELYHQHLHRYPTDSMENVWYLSMALRSPFANPLNALAVIENEKEWEKYRNLFTMHVYLELIEQYLAIAAKYDKFQAYFFNYPWKAANLDSLRTAEEYYELALRQWEEVLRYQEVVQEDRFRWIHLDEVQYWEDEAYRIETGDLDYREIIEGHLSRLNNVRAAFERMGPDTY